MVTFSLSGRYRHLPLFCFILLAHISAAQHWQPVTGSIPGVRFTGIASDVSSPAIIAATLNAGIYRSMDSGSSWQHVYITQDTIFSLTNLDGLHFCAGGKGLVYSSSDSGVSWTAAPFPFPVAVGKLLLHPSGALIAGTGSKWDINGNNSGKGVWLSIDTGKTWSSLNTGITKQDPLIEALAITPSGMILAGIYDHHVGTGGKFGIMKLNTLQDSWERIPVSVQAPFNQYYSDQNLRIGSVFNINIAEGQVLSSIEGTYINFGYAFTIQKDLGDMNDTSVAWKVKWVEDSIPGAGSYYEHLINIFKDSRDMVWASVSVSGNEINNDIFTGSLSSAVPWTLSMDSLTSGGGRFLFSEGTNGRLYTVSYFTGSQIFVRNLSGTPVGLPAKENSHWRLFPNPAGHYLRLSHSVSHSEKNTRFTIYDLAGNKVMEQDMPRNNEMVVPLSDYCLPEGIYILSIGDEKEKQLLRFLKN